MKQNAKVITPRCGICKKLYSSKDDDGSGLCLKCRPVNSQPVIPVKRQIKQTFMLEVGKRMEHIDQEDIQKQEGVDEAAAVEDCLWQNRKAEIGSVKMQS